MLYQQQKTPEFIPDDEWTRMFYFLLYEANFTKVDWQQYPLPNNSFVVGSRKALLY